MSGFFLDKPSQEDMEYDGIFNGENKSIPDGTILNAAVTGGFFGIEEGKSIQVCIINLVVTSPGDFYGQTYKYNAKIFDMDKQKSDKSKKHLSVIDAQAGFPFTDGRLDITTENIEQYWVGNSEVRVEFGFMLSTHDMNGNPHLDAEGNPTTKDINWIKGFGYLREKMVKPAGEEPQQEQQATQASGVNEKHFDFQQPTKTSRPIPQGANRKGVKMSIELGDLSEKVLDVFREQIAENDISVEEIVKCLGFVTSTTMSEAGIERVTTPEGTLTLEQN